MDLGLKNKKVLITGATGGIGEKTAKLFAKEGALVIVHYNKNKKKALKLANELDGDVNHFAIQADLSNEEQTIEMYNTLDKKFGRIDILICNAGIWPEEYCEIADMEFQRWKETVKIDLDSVFLSTRSFIKQLIKYQKDNASIIIVGSTAAVFGEAGHADYSSAKAAITYGLTKSLKNEIVTHARLGRVNAVCPGWTVTPMTEKYLDDENGIKEVLKTVPLKKIGQAVDIASSIVWLSSDIVSGHISGSIVTIAGGMEGRSLNLPEEIDISKAFKKE